MKHLKILTFLSLTILSVNLTFSQIVKINTVNPIGINQIPEIVSPQTDVLVENAIQLSKSFTGMPKIIGHVNSSPIYSQTDFWPLGSWYNGYDDQANFFTDPGDTGYPGTYWGSHPLYRHTDQQIRALIHLDKKYKLDPIANVNVNDIPLLIDNGLNYLITQQRPNGGYTNWTIRPVKNVYNQDDNFINIPFGRNVYANAIHVYETGSALATMCDGYLYKKENGVISTNLYSAIVKAADNILAMGSDFGTFSNTNNFRAFGAWGLAKAYKVTNDCKYLIGARNLCQTLIDDQHKLGTMCYGTWQTGADDGPGGNSAHDAKTNYHLTILKGLIETFDIIPNTMYDFKIELSNTIKRGINQIILYRLDPQLGYLHDWWTNRQCYTIGDVSQVMYYYGDQVEPIAALAYYANLHPDFFDNDERNSLKNLLNSMSRYVVSQIDPTTPSLGDRDATMRLHSFAYYANYMDAINNPGEKIFEEDGITHVNNYDANKITGRTVSGDFDNDGKKDDIAAFFDYGVSETRIHVWKGESELFDYQEATGWWSSTGYDANKITDRIVVGDFDNDGYEDDIAAFYDYGSDQTRIHMFLGNNGSFTYSGALGWWNIVGYDANAITGRVVAGDFDNDNYKDDIAVFYDYGNSGSGNETRIHMFEGRANYFSYASNYGWWNTVGYNANAITNRVVSGDFDSDGKEDDIAAFYDYGSGQTRIHMFLGQNSWFYYPSNLGWWNTTGYDANAITGRVVSGDFDDDGKNDDIAAFYDYGGTETRMHVFEGRNNYFSYPSNYGLWNVSSGYDANSITGRVVSGDFFDPNGTDNNISVIYDIGPNETRIHTWNLNTNPWEMEYAGAGGKWVGCLPSIYINSNRYGNLENLDNKLDNIVSSNTTSELTIYPNPTSSRLTIDSRIEIKEISIIHLTGKIIKTMTGDLNKIDVADLTPGIYFINLLTEEKTITKKFIKQ